MSLEDGPPINITLRASDVDSAPVELLLSRLPTRGTVYLPASAPLPAQIGAGLLPAAGALLAATGAAPWLTPLGGIAAALLATATGLLLLARTRELHELGK